MADVLLAAAGIILVTVALGLVPIVRGASATDNILAVQLFGTGGVAVLLLLGAVSGAEATSAASAAGKLSVTSGMRLACTTVSAFFALVAAFVLSSVPHTRQRVAFSLRRVPHVGQICDF